MSRLTTVKTADELLSMRDDDGVIHVKGNVAIECGVPITVGIEINEVHVNGDLHASGPLHVNGDMHVSGSMHAVERVNALGDLSVRGDMDVMGDLYAQGALSVHGDLHTAGCVNVQGDIDVQSDLFAGGHLRTSGGLYVGSDLDVLGNLDVGGDHAIVMRDLTWSHAAMPTLPEQTYIRRVLPPPWQRDHWQERLGMDIGSGCYDEICRTVLEQIHILLRNEKWTPTERWMLETLRDSRKGVPEWVGAHERSRE